MFEDNEMVMAHEPYQFTTKESDDYGFTDDGDGYHSVTECAIIIDAWGQEVSSEAFLEEIDGKMWPVSCYIEMGHWVSTFEC